MGKKNNRRIMLEFMALACFFVGVWAINYAHVLCTEIEDVSIDIQTDLKSKTVKILDYIGLFFIVSAGILHVISPLTKTNDVYERRKRRKLRKELLSRVVQNNTTEIEAP